MSAPATERRSLEPFLKDDVEYYEHQVIGIRTMARMKSVLLGDDMGLGKSLQALTVFCIDVKMGLSETLLIVCPVTLRDNWADEIEKFTRLPYTLLGEEPHPLRKGRMRKISTTAKRDAQLRDWLSGHGPRILIANYEQIASAAHEKTLAGANFDMVIMDEAHYIKTHNSRRTKSALALNSTRSLLLTGTPMLNQVNELWPLLHRIDPKKFPKYWWFVNRYCVMGGYQGKAIVGVKNEAELTGHLTQYMIRRRKKDWLKLPEPQIIQVKVGLNDVQQKLYDEARDDLVLQGGDISIANAMVLFLRLKQICDTPYAVSTSFADESQKLDRLEQIAEEICDAGEKLVIFTQFRGVLECIMRRLKARLPKVPIFELHGDVPTGARVPLVHRWSDVDGPAIIACMTQVAGVGLNMTAASTCVFVDKLFVPGLNRQAIDRLHRIGQSETQAIRVFELIARGTCEDRVELILRAKSKLNDDIVEGSLEMKKLLEELARVEAES